MRFEKLLRLLDGEPLFRSSLLLTDDLSVNSMRKQLSRWVSKGKIIQLKRGLYAVASPYRVKELHPFLIANMLKRASYVSLQSALEYYGMIPEYVPTVTSVTTGRPGVIGSAFGRYQYRHIKKRFFWGYIKTEVIKDTEVFIAEPEKALLDLIYLNPYAEKKEFLKELRLQNTEKINIGKMTEFIKRSGVQKLQRALGSIVKIIKEEQ
jgi:predicted transcriptional regulator of viral defense system